MNKAVLKQENPVAVSDVRVLKISTCPSISGRSTLTYHLGVSPESDIKLRVFANSGGGFFSNEWVQISAVQKEFEKVPDGIALTPHLLSPLFRGRSANNQSFLFAVLKNEGLVSTVKDRKGRFERADAGAFMAEIETLVASNVDLKVDVTPAPVRSVKPQKLVPGFDDVPRSAGVDKANAPRAKKKAA
jgi:hypothetical protein